MKWLNIGISIASMFFSKVREIESLAKVLPTLKGADKQNAVMTLVKDSLETVELAAGKDLLNDAEVDKAARAVIDAYVAFQNVVAKKAV